MGLEAFETSPFPTGLIAEVQKCIVLRRASNASHDFSPLQEPPNSQTLPKRGGCVNFPCLLHPKFQATVPTLHFWHGSDSSKKLDWCDVLNPHLPAQKEKNKQETFSRPFIPSSIKQICSRRTADTLWLKLAVTAACCFVCRAAHVA